MTNQSQKPPQTPKEQENLLTVKKAAGVLNIRQLTNSFNFSRGISENLAERLDRVPLSANSVQTQQYLDSEAILRSLLDKGLTH